MSRIMKTIQGVVRQEMGRSRGSMLGVVTTVYPHLTEDDENNYEANVRLKHEDLELRRVPIAVSHVGVAAPPRAGDLVLVQFVGGDPNQPLVTGRFYHAGERPPLHKEGEILFEQRVSDGTLNHLRFADDGSIFLQRDVTKPEDNTEAKTGIMVEKEGNVEIRVGEKIKIRLTVDDETVAIECTKMKIKGDVDINGVLKVEKDGQSTTISGHEITGA